MSTTTTTSTKKTSTVIQGTLSSGQRLNLFGNILTLHAKGLHQGQYRDKITSFSHNNGKITVNLNILGYSIVVF